MDLQPRKILQPSVLSTPTMHDDVTGMLSEPAASLALRPITALSTSSKDSGSSGCKMIDSVFGSSRNDVTVT